MPDRAARALEILKSGSAGRMQQMELLHACERKYPDIDATMAKTALLYHSDIDHTEKVDFIGINIKWPEVADRLKQAAANPQLTFAPGTALKLLQNKHQRNIKPSKGKGLGL